MTVASEYGTLVLFINDPGANISIAARASISDEIFAFFVAYFSGKAGKMLYAQTFGIVKTVFLAGTSVL